MLLQLTRELLKGVKHYNTLYHFGSGKLFCISATFERIIGLTYLH